MLTQRVLPVLPRSPESSSQARSRPGLGKPCQKAQAEELAEQLESAMEICQMDGGPQVYLPTLQAEAEMIRRIGAAKNYKELNQRLEDASFGRIGAARGKGKAAGSGSAAEFRSLSIQ